MSVVENLARQELEPSPALQPRAQIDDMEAVFNSLSIEAENDVRILGDQLTATSICAKRLRHEWRSLIDRSLSNGSACLQGLARAQTPAETVELQKSFAQAQIAAMQEYWNQCGRLAVTGAAECAGDK